MLLNALVAFLLSMSPFGEQKLGIPFAIAKDIQPMIAFGIGIMGNLLIIPIMFFFMDRTGKFMMRYKWYKKMAVWLSRSAQRKTGNLMKKHGFWGLMLFVAVPLPVTGAYVGSIAAWLFKVNRKQAYISIGIGVIISGIIVTLVSGMGSKMLAAL